MVYRKETYQDAGMRTFFHIDRALTNVFYIVLTILCIILPNLAQYVLSDYIIFFIYMKKKQKLHITQYNT